MWLEELRSPEVRRWVAAHNRKTVKVLEGPVYSAVYDELDAILNSPERLPLPVMAGGMIYNHWRDEEHHRGLWRRTTPEGYRLASPPWETLLDLDRLAAEERRNWIFKGAQFLEPEAERCLLLLSDSGTDAVAMREFFPGRRRFARDGFNLPVTLAGVDWKDADTLYYSPEEPPTRAGYPSTVGLLRRSGAFERLGQGPVSDVGWWPEVRHHAGRRFDLVRRYLGYDRCQLYRIVEDRLEPIETPVDARLHTVFEGKLILELDTPWQGIPGGTLVAVPVEGGEPEAVFRPGPRQSVTDAQATRSQLIVEVLEDVVPTIYAGNRRLHTGEIVATSPFEDRFYVVDDHFLTPDRLLEVAGATVTPLHSLPPQFEAQAFETIRGEAVSKDGTRVPYFLVRRRGATGPAPTLMTAYGGFELSLTPDYLLTEGKVWLERGGSFVQATIRGGGEFGPQWHEAGRLKNRQRSLEDVFAVAEDLVVRGHTTPEQLGFRGGSHGGLIGGAALAQRPDLFGAVVLQVPVLDLLRYHTLHVGSTWLEEYGDPGRAEDAAWLRALSPLHNLEPGVNYPPVLLTASTADDRVHPAHARKLTARLESLGQPVLYYEQTEGGHEAAPTGPQEGYVTALEYAFLIRHLMPGPEK